MENNNNQKQPKLYVKPVHTWSHYTKKLITDLTLSNILGSFTTSTNYWKAVRTVETLFIVVPTCCGSLCYALIFKFCSFASLYSSAIILLRKRPDWFALMWCGYLCSVPLPNEAVSQSAVCDCEISWSYSFVERRRLLAIQIPSSLYTYMK